jgi:hypothetical protein
LVPEGFFKNFKYTKNGRKHPINPSKSYLFDFKYFYYFNAELLFWSYSKEFVKMPEKAISTKVQGRTGHITRWGTPKAIGAAPPS